MSTSPVVVIIPVKPPSVGKSRLGMSNTRRTALATGFALDTIAAVLATPAVAHALVVTDDFRFASTARDLGSAVIPDGVAGDLNASLVQAALEAARRWPAHRVAALCADVPALTPDDLDAALAAAEGSATAFVRDTAGTGTSLYVATRVDDFEPQFGNQSAELHLRGGAHELMGGLPPCARTSTTPVTSARRWRWASAATPRRRCSRTEHTTNGAHP
ncbi:2-phospho-L-lactate guanylyltransferase [Nocardioides alcanivorans]|uniref:2-phospho-L-lactate guanylyltransferase n=1 Tax=Nocardioides alcanivorans TaxID=2897352 RepID=UPI001F41D1BF|nr:2-phospho-L-lactate guanylyltransferase [Nocardioides alcanivorans]